MSTTNENVELVLRFALKFYDSTIAILLFLLLFLDTLLANSPIESNFYIYVLLGIILFIDLGFNTQIVPFLLRLNSLMNATAKKTLEKFIKAVAYLLILVQVFISPIPVPLTFLVPNVASIDFYFFLLVLLLTGLYFSTLQVFLVMFKPERRSAN